LPETIKGYLETAAEQIRWKRARPVLVQELERHLEDQRDDFIKEGRPEDEAERLAIRDMGDPVEVGAELDRVHRPKPQWGLLGLVIALALVGAFLRVTLQAGRGWGERSLLVNALLSLALGTGALLGMYFLDVSRLARHARAVYIAALALGMLALDQSPYANGVSWYARYAVQLYPAAYAVWLYSFRGKGWKGLLLAILGGVPPAVICCMTPSMMGLLLLLFSGLVMTLHAAWQDWFGIGRRKGLCAVLIAAFGVLASQLYGRNYDYLDRRLSVALHPELDPTGMGYWGTQLRKILDSVPLLRSPYEGMGFHTGTLVYDSGGKPLLNLSGDFLPAAAVVRWGWLPFLLLLGALGVLLVWMLVKGLRQKHCLGRLVVLAVVVTLAGQMLFSVILNLGFVLFSASLPLVAGNLQTVIDMGLIGLALSVFRGDSILRDEPAEPLRQRKHLRIRLEYQ